MKYKLLKDMPQVIKGSILKKSGANYVIDNVKIPVEIVEKTPEWFAQVGESIYIQPFMTKERCMIISVVIAEGYDGAWTVAKIYEKLSEYINDTFNNPKF